MPTRLNPLRAKFLREIINIHLHFMKFLHIDITHIAPNVVQELTHST